MKVKELIEHLQKVDPELNVVLEEQEGYCKSPWRVEVCDLAFFGEEETDENQFYWWVDPDYEEQLPERKALVVMSDWL